MSLNINFSELIQRSLSNTRPILPLPENKYTARVHCGGFNIVRGFCLFVCFSGWWWGALKSKPCTCPSSFLLYCGMFAVATYSLENGCKIILAMSWQFCFILVLLCNVIVVNARFFLNQYAWLSGFPGPGSIHSQGLRLRHRQ